VKEGCTGALSERFYLSSEQQEMQRSEHGLDLEGLLRSLVSGAQPLAVAPISGFQVVAAGANARGEIFLGVNLEFCGTTFAQTVHAEQFLLSLSRTYSSSPLVKIAVSAPPCGHCRQFLKEFDREGELEILIGNEPATSMGALFPRSFGPADLDVSEPFYVEPPELPEGGDLEEAARRAARHSYVPYSGSRAGVAVRTEEGRIFCGAALENAAYNPTLPPLQAAIISAYAAGFPPHRIVEAVLCQSDKNVINYETQMHELASVLGDGAVCRAICF